MADSTSERIDLARLFPFLREPEQPLPLPSTRVDCVRREVPVVGVEADGTAELSVGVGAVMEDVSGACVGVLEGSTALPVGWRAGAVETPLEFPSWRLRADI